MTTSKTHELAAGAFSSWLDGMQGALRGDRSSDVPCGGCTACCTASQFIHIGPGEADTLAHIPPRCCSPRPVGRAVTCCSGTTSAGTARC